LDGEAALPEQRVEAARGRREDELAAGVEEGASYEVAEGDYSEALAGLCAEDDAGAPRVVPSAAPDLEW
jgi:hypothetical protein